VPPDAVSVVIPTMDGLRYLRENLPPLVKALERYGGSWELVIADNASSDGTCAFLAREYPMVRVVVFPVNRGFGPACNAAIAVCRHGLVLLLNNDVRVTEHFLAPLVRWFAAADVFSVQSLSLGDDMRRPVVPERSFHLLHTCGGYTLYDREKLLHIGGFHPLYAPFYGEDRDSAHRAWKRGWRSLCDPASVVYHRGESTSRRFSSAYIERIKVRNRLIFLWSVLDSPWRSFQRSFSLLLQVVFTGRLSGFWGFFDAWRRRRAIAEKKRTDRPHWVLTDVQIRARIAKGAT